MDNTESRTLVRELSETLLLLMIAGFTLAGYLGIAMVLVDVAR